MSHIGCCLLSDNHEQAAKIDRAHASGVPPCRAEVSKRVTRLMRDLAQCDQRIEHTVQRAITQLRNCA